MPGALVSDARPLIRTGNPTGTPTARSHRGRSRRTMQNWRLARKEHSTAFLDADCHSLGRPMLPRREPRVRSGSRTYDIHTHTEACLVPSASNSVHRCPTDGADGFRGPFVASTASIAAIWVGRQKDDLRKPVNYSLPVAPSTNARHWYLLSVLIPVPAGNWGLRKTFPQCTLWANFDAAALVMRESPCDASNDARLTAPPRGNLWSYARCFPRRPSVGIVRRRST